MQQKKISIDVSRVAILAKLPISDTQKKLFTTQLLSVLGFMSKIQSLNTKDVIETSQVTGLTNVFREDTIDTKRIFSQKEALQNAKRSYKGFFVVPAVFE